MFDRKLLSIVAISAGLATSLSAKSAWADPCAPVNSPDTVAENIINQVLDRVGKVQLRSAWTYDSEDPAKITEARLTGGVKFSDNIDFDLLSGKNSRQGINPFVHIDSKDVRALMKVEKIKNTGANDGWNGTVRFARSAPDQNYLAANVTLRNAKVYDWKIYSFDFKGKDILNPDKPLLVNGSCAAKNKAFISLKDDGSDGTLKDLDATCQYVFTFDKKCNKWTQKISYSDMNDDADLPSVH